MKVSVGSSIIVPELEESACANVKWTLYPKEVDEILLAYGGRASWNKIREYCNNAFDMRKSATAYRSRWCRLRENMVIEEAG